MSSRKLFRIAFLSLALAMVVFLMASSVNQEIKKESAVTDEKDGPRKMPSEFIIWESMGNTILSASGF